MLRVDDFVRRRRTLVFVVWGAILAIAAPLSMHQSDHLTGGGFEVPGSQSAAVQHEISRDFAHAHAATLAAVLVPRAGASAAQERAALVRLATATQGVAHVALAPAERARAEQALASGSARPLIVPLATSTSDDGAIDVAVKLRKHLGLNGSTSTPSGPVATHLVGEGALWAGMQDLTKHDLKQAESGGFPIVLLILLAVFGSLVAALLPLSLGVVAVTVTGALVYLLSQATEMSVFVTNMASMIGIGVAVDYSLFVLSRYREEIAGGRAPEDARAIALATSGVAVTFSGLAVIVSLAGLFVVDVTAIRSMAMGAIIVVAVAALAATTLLPALISAAGRRAYEPGRVAGLTARIARAWQRRAGRGGEPREPFWGRWTAAVMRRPVRAIVAAGGVLLVLAIPALQLHVGNGALWQFPKDNEVRVGVEAASRITGPGAASPVEVIAPRAQLARVNAALHAEREVVRVAAPVPSRDGSRVLVRAILREDGESTTAGDAVQRLRAQLPESAIAGGTPGFTRDILDRVKGSLPLIALVVLGLSYLVLLLLLRSVVLPLKAILMNLLSVGAAYGVLVAVFQWGWADGFLGYHAPGKVDVLTPPLVLAIVFGLSMDYEVFLLSRIRERWTATRDPRRAVAEGLQGSARTITSAALIMSAVFSVFVLTGVPSIKQLGLGCAVAIALDATLVRLVLVPAAMELLGQWNWWMPRRLARALPNIAVEEAPVRVPSPVPNV
jgi:RND superfamily putative drug exporter